MDLELTVLSGVRWRGEEIAGERLRRLLVLLAGDLRAGCSSSRLVEALWPEELPSHPAKALQTLVSRARARLGVAVIESTRTGYRLALDPAQVDASVVLLRAAESARLLHAGDAGAAVASASAGLALFGSDGADDLRAATYRELTRVRALGLARLGRSAEALPLLLAQLARAEAQPARDEVQPARAEAQPARDEEVLLELLRCEAATAGSAAALARYDAYRRSLRDELGADPGPGLRAFHRELLLSDAPPVRHGLRHEPNEMLGRDDDIAAVTALLRTAKVVSIVGAGGLGKTRLAQAVARRARQRVVCVVELAGVTGDVLGEVASALGVGESGAVEGVVGALGPGEALLVLDNCEHLVEDVAAVVQALVSRAADLRVLTTSRAPLGLSSESVYPLAELDLPTTVELFARRARAARPGVELPADAVRELCLRLDGLPLAVELAAARVRVMSVAEIGRRLDDRFAVLRGGARDAPERHRTLYAVIDWSWHLLSADGQAAMRALSIFPGGIAIDAAGDVDQLVDQSLLKVVDEPGGTRYRMLETVRSFSAARREEAGETSAAVDRFLAWARGMGAMSAEEGVAAVETIRAEQDNLTLALRYGLERGDGGSVAAAASLLGTLWLTESNVTRMIGMAAEVPAALSGYRPADALVEATRTAAVWCALIMYLVRGPRPLRALAVLRRLPPPPPDSLIGAAQIVLLTPDPRELGDDPRPVIAAMANYALSYQAEYANDPKAALRAAKRMLGLLDDADPWLRALAHARIGELCLQASPGEEAYRHLETALSIMESLGAWSSAARARWALVLANLQRGALDQAEQDLNVLGRQEDGPPLFDLCSRAQILLGRGDVDGGLALWRQAAEGLRGSGDLWAHEVQAVAVIVHRRHGQEPLIEHIALALPKILSELLPTAPAAVFRVCGVLLLAVGLSRGASELVALAERFGVSSTFLPLSAVAPDTDHEALRAEALALLSDLD
ncbi:ATP-binding protein [Actinoplanes sp. NPDC051513]|uniref:ATP-binding protein n=1 Tax=Actinoplanes sp. NPDC051513 TaxID=3363908 RepID=UPI00379D3679